MTCAAELSADSASSLSGTPSAIAACCIIRASWPAPTTPTTGVSTAARLMGGHAASAACSVPPDRDRLHRPEAANRPRRHRPYVVQVGGSQAGGRARVADDPV